MENTEEPSEFFKEYFNKYLDFTDEIANSNAPFKEKLILLSSISIETLITILLEPAKKSKSKHAAEFIDEVVRKLKKIIQETTLH